MEQVGVRELRREASAILRRVSAGETIQITDRGRPVAVIVRVMPEGLARLEEEGSLRRSRGDLLEIKPVPVKAGTRPPSELVSEGRAE